MKALMIAILISSFIILAVAQAQFEPPTVDTLGPLVFSYPGGRVVIFSPRNSLNYANQIQLIFTVEKTGFFGQFGNVGVSIDGGVINSVTDFKAKSVVPIDNQYNMLTTVLASITLPTLSEGAHNATVYFGWQYLGTHQRYDVSAYSTVDFMVVNADATNVSTAVSDIKSYTAPEISVSSPLNKTYNANYLSLNSTLRYGYLISTNASVCYSMDRKDNITISSGEESGLENGEVISIPYNLEISNLSDGLHNLTVYSEITCLNYGSSASSSVQFIIDTSPPTISGLSIENKTYTLQTIQLSFNVDENVSWVAYNLDNQGNTTMQGSTTLTGLSEGSHSIVVYANDTLGNMGKSDTVFFTVNTPTAEDFTSAIVLSGIIVIIVAVGLSVYFKKRKH